MAGAFWPLFCSCQPFMIFWGMLFNVPVVYMGRDVMILMRENPFRGPLEGAGLKIETFLVPMKGQKAKRVPFGSKKVPTLLK